MGVGSNIHLPRALDSPPPDKYNAAYLIFFNLGAGFLFPWNAFITAADYFGAIYPGEHVDRLFSVFYMIPNLLVIVLLLFFGRHYTSSSRILGGFTFFLVLLAAVPILDVLQVHGNRGTTLSLAITVGAVSALGICDATVQGSLFGLGSELPDRYIQALNGGTGASGLIVSLLRLATKAMLPPTTEGMRQSAMLYFFVSALFVTSCIVSFKILDTLPVIKYYRSFRPIRLPLLDDQESNASDLAVEGSEEGLHLFWDGDSEAPQLADSASQPGKMGLPEETNPSLLLKRDKPPLVQPEKGWQGTESRGSTPRDPRVALGAGIVQVQAPVSYCSVLVRIWPHCFSLGFTYVVTLSIFPGFMAEDVHSLALGDWYPIILIMLFNLFDFTGKMLPAMHPVFSPTLDSAAPLVWYSVARLVFYPAFILSLYGPPLLRTELPMVFLTAALGLSNGQLTSLTMMTAPKRATPEEAETVGMLMVLSLVIGLTIGALASWLWVI